MTLFCCDWYSARMFPNCFLSNACVYCTYTVVLDMLCIFFKRFTMSEIVQTTAPCFPYAGFPYAGFFAQAFLTQAFPAQAFLAQASLAQAFFVRRRRPFFFFCSCLYFDRNSFLDVPEAFTPQALSQGVVPPKALTKPSPKLFKSSSATMWTLSG